MNELALVALLLPLLSACSSHEPVKDSVSPSTGNSYAPRHPRTAVQLTNEVGETLTVQAEVVSEGLDRQRGLMFREYLPDGAGMLFLFDKEEEHSFWMKNTLIPLDMLFITADKTVAGIVHQAVPKSEESRTVGVPSQYVLEVPGGYCARNKIGRGSKVQFSVP